MLFNIVIDRETENKGCLAQCQPIEKENSPVKRIMHVVSFSRLALLSLNSSKGGIGHGKFYTIRTINFCQ